MRVLHVIDATGPAVHWDAMASCAACTRTLSTIDQRVLLIGSSRARRDARALGLDAPTILSTVAPPLGNIEAAVSGTRRFAHDLNELRWTPDIIHAWSPKAAGLVGEVLPGIPIVESRGGRPAPVPDAATRDALRIQLAVRENESVILLAADAAGVGDGRRFAGLMGALELDEHVALGIMSDRVESGPRAARYLASFGRQWDVTAVDEPPLAILSAADIVVWDQGDRGHADGLRSFEPTGGIVIAACHAGIPVVTTDSPIARRLLHAAADDCIARDTSMPQMARLVRRFMVDQHARENAVARLRHAHPSTCEESLKIAERWNGALRARETALHMIGAA